MIVFGLALLCLFSAAPLNAKNEKPAAGNKAAVKTVSGIKEYGAYVKLNKGYVRILPNIVFDEGSVFFIESNNPAHFFLKDVEYFVLYGQHDMSRPYYKSHGVLSAVITRQTALRIRETDRC